MNMVLWIDNITSKSMFTTDHGRRRGGARGALAPPGIWKNDVICCRPTKCPKIFASAFGARNRCSIFKYKTTQKNAKIFEKWSIFGTARRKRVDFLTFWWFCHPLEKFLRAPMPLIGLIIIRNWKYARIIQKLVLIFIPSVVASFKADWSVTKWCDFVIFILDVMTSFQFNSRCKSYVTLF